MLLTPLYLQALTWSQWVTDSIFRYRSFVYWDKGLIRFVRESRPRHNIPFLLSNYGLIGSFIIPGLITFFLQSLRHPEQASIIQLISAGTQLFISIEALVTAVAYLKWGSEWLDFLQKIIIFEFSTWKKYAVSSPKARQKNRGMFRQIRLPNGEVDWIGLVAISLVPACAVIPFFLPSIAMWLELDTVFLISQHLIVVPDLSSHGSIIYYLCRLIVCTWHTIELCNCVRVLALCAILSFKAIHSCHSFLMVQTLSDEVLKELTQLRIITTDVLDFTAFLFSIHLSCMYCIVIMCTTLAVTTVNLIPWHFYAFVVLIGSINLAIVVIVLFLVVSVDRSSLDLQSRWMQSCGDLTISVYSRRLFYKTLISIQPIRVPYGTLGSFTGTTRTDFLHSLATNSINSIVTLRESIRNL